MSFLSKMFNAFKSIKLNDKNAVSGQSLDHLLVSSMYAEQQSAYLNSYETGLDKSDRKEIVEKYWGVYNQGDAMNILQDLLYRNQDTNINIVYAAFENKENYVEILKANLPDDKEAFDYYVDLYRNLNNVVPELIEQKVIADFSELKNIKDTGWNYGRGAFLARCCYELGYLTEKGLKEYLQQAHTGLKNYCNTWKEYTISYIFGRAIWGGSNNSGMIQIANDLLENAKSPLKNKKNL